MSIRSHLARRACPAFLVVLACFVADARAQLVLPKDKPTGATQQPAPTPESKPLPPRTPGNLAPYITCSVCAERNYIATRSGRLDQNGLELAWCAVCKRDTGHKPPVQEQHKLTDKGKTAPAGLALPTPGAGGLQPAAPGASSRASASASPATADARFSAANAAAELFSEVRASRDKLDSVVASAVPRLLALGPPALAVARTELAAQEPPVLLTAARALLVSNSSDDFELVKLRLQSRLPPAAGAPLVDALARANPVAMSPRVLAELLDHPHAGVRSAAERHLRAHLDPSLLALLEPALASTRSETRLQALAIMADIDDPSVTNRLLEHLADPTAKVASAVVSELATREDRALDARLLGLALRHRWILRESCYALIAIVEREDLLLAPVLDETHVEALLTGMQSQDPFVSGTCATALAGIGFRSPRTRDTLWLDQAVVDRLVATVSGKEFHNDISALERPALRRLKLVSGQEIGSDGPRWLAWWLTARPGFYARRAYVEVGAQDAGLVSLRYLARAEPDGDFALLGPKLDRIPDGMPAAEALWITAAEERDLLALLAREGVLGPDRLPGLRGSHGKNERGLEVAVAGRGKSFTFGADANEAWFERVTSTARALRDRNRWQRYPRPGKQATQYALWLDESAWWSLEHTDRERSLRLKTMVFEALPVANDEGRERGIAELERLYEQEQAAQPADFTLLLALLNHEIRYAERAHRLVVLAARAASSSKAGSGAPGNASSAAPGNPTPATLATQPAEDLVNLLHDRFHAEAKPDLLRVFALCDNAMARKMARDVRPLMRAVAAETLAARGRGGRTLDMADVEVLAHLLEDKDQSVEIAAVLALGENKVEKARTELLVRARLAAVPVRAAALRAVGKLGGELVLDALVLALSDTEPEIKLAAAEGLSDLADPASVQLMIGLLAQGADAPVFAPARSGLRRLGVKAWPDLLRLVHSAAHPARREVALLLAEQCSADAVSPLLMMLTTAPGDARIASELAILTCVDFRAEADPAGAWWGWWDGVVHDDPLAWFLAALVRTSKTPPERAAFEGRGTLEVRRFLVGVMDHSEAFLAERARREYARLEARDIGELPPAGARRKVWLDALRAQLDPKREQ